MSTCAFVTESTREKRRTRSWWNGGPERVRRLVTAIVLALPTILVSSGTVQAAERASPPPRCDVGVFCAWEQTDYKGQPHRFDLRGTSMEECVPLNSGFEARSFVNRIDRPVTVYQDAHCATVADFSTYPGGSHVPRAPYVVRAIQIWTH